MENLNLLKSSKDTTPVNLANAVTMEVKTKGKAIIGYIGASAGNQAWKAFAIARGVLTSQGYDIWGYPMFDEVADENKEIKTSMRIIVEDKGYKCKQATQR